MPKELKDDIKARFALLSKMVDQAGEKLSAFPDGRIKIKHRGEKAYYYQTNVNDSGEKLLTDKALIAALIQKGYITKVLSVAKNERDYLKKVLNGYPGQVVENVYEQLTEERKNAVKPIVLTDEQFVSKWKNTPYSQKPFSNDTPFFIEICVFKIYNETIVGRLI